MNEEDFEIRPLNAPGQMHACEELQKEVWGFPDREIVPLVELVSASKAGGSLAGAYRREDLVGFVYGMWGFDGSEIYHYSRMLAVKASFRGRGLGFRLKAWQRDFTMKRGVNLMRWTFDPLEGANASLNVAGLGVVADEYILDYYGQKQDALNRGLPTDRFFVKWFLDSPRTADRLSGTGTRMSLDEILGTGPALVASRPGNAGRPEPRVYPPRDGGGPFHLEIPGDVQALKRDDLGLASAWREAVREACIGAFSRGFRVEEFASAVVDGARRSAYLLRKHGPGRGKPERES